MRRSGLAIALVLALLAGLAPRGSALPPERLVTIHRDGFGVPHVTGKSREATAYGVGYAMATDRLFEMDVIRRLGQGRLSEILGEGSDADGDGIGDTLEADMIMRREFYDAEDIARQTRELPAEIRELQSAFSDGVNRAIAEQTANPLEQSILFGALGYEPEPWSPEDSTSVLLLFTMVSFAGEGEGGELSNAALLRRLIDEHGSSDGLEIWQDLVLSIDPEAEGVIDAGEGPGPPDPPLTATDPHAEQIDLALDIPILEEAIRIERDEVETLRRVLETLPHPKVGSYAVAASGERTASGGSLLFGAPQAGFLAPSVFWEFGLHAPGVDCTGFTVPGLGPVMGIGWCNDHAWTLVAGNAGDQVDVYVEEIRRDGEGFEYKLDGEWYDMQIRQETYVVKSTTSGKVPQVVSQEILATVHGPVFAMDAEEGVAFTRRRSQAGAFAQTFEGSYALTYGDGFDEVEAGAERITATYNFIYADRAGNIAYRFTGWQPVRAAGADLRLPMPGTGSFEWRSPALPFEAMPHVTNPERGMINVNQGVDSKPIEWWPRSSEIFIGRFGHTKADKGFFEAADELDIQGMEDADRALISEEDILTPLLDDVISKALAGVRPGTDLARAKALYEDWRARGYPRVDGDEDGRLDHPALTLFSVDRLNFRNSPVWGKWVDGVFRDNAGVGLPGPYIGRIGMALAAVESPRIYSQPYRDNAFEAFRSALSSTIDELRERDEFAGRPMEEWRVPAPTTSFEAVGLLTPEPMDVVDHGSYQQIVDFGKDRGVNVLPPGNGRADRAVDVARFQATGELPEHFVDQTELYEAFDHKLMRMQASEFVADAESVEVLVYPGT